MGNFCDWGILSFLNFLGLGFTVILKILVMGV